jgi:hypothetical protein
VVRAYLGEEFELDEAPAGHGQQVARP